jgi:hypothetical protein
MAREDRLTHVWLQRLTDDANTWLTAVRLEEQGDILNAALYYLRDAKISIECLAGVRGALSASCAADCIWRLGDREKSSRLYLEAAKLYSENAITRISSSIREALWSLQEAYECFSLANDEIDANETRNIFMSLARRANPFIGERDAFNLPEKRSLIAEIERTGSLQGGQLKSAEIQVSYDEFLHLVAHRKTERKLGAVSNDDILQEFDTADDQNFISQLG